MPVVVQETLIDAALTFSVKGYQIGLWPGQLYAQSDDLTVYEWSLELFMNGVLTIYEWRYELFTNDYNGVKNNEIYPHIHQSMAYPIMWFALFSRS